MQQLCNLVYADLAQNRNKVQMAELDAVLAPPSEKEKHQARMNQESMAQLGIGMVAPPKPRQSPKRRTRS